jgi:hypothetical protein
MVKSRGTHWVGRVCGIGRTSATGKVADTSFETYSEAGTTLVLVLNGIAYGELRIMSACACPYVNQR